MPSMSLKCDYCTLPASNNTFGEEEDLLICKDCSLKGELSFQYILEVIDGEGGGGYNKGVMVYMYLKCDYCILYTTSKQQHILGRGRSADL